MGAVLSLPFFRRRTRRRRTPVSTPISHPRPLLRRNDLDKTEELELLAIAKSQSTHHSASTAGSRIVRSGSGVSRTSRRVRRRPGEFGQETIPEVLQPNDTLPSVPSMSSATASDSSCSTKPSLSKPEIPVDISAPSPLPLPLQAPRPGSVAPPVGSKRRLEEPRRQRRPSSATARRNSIIGTKPRRVSTRKRRIESGWDVIRHDEADGWAPAAGRAGGKRVRLAWPGA